MPTGGALATLSRTAAPCPYWQGATAVEGPLPDMSDDSPCARLPQDPAVIRAALDQCMTLADIEQAMGWSAGTAARTRWRPEPAGLPEPDHFIGRTPVWFQATFEAWRDARPGMGARPAGTEGPRASDRRPVAPPLAGYRIVASGLDVPEGADVDVIAYVHGSWRPVEVRGKSPRSVDVRYRLDSEPAPGEHVQRVGISRVAVPIATEES